MQHLGRLAILAGNIAKPAYSGTMPYSNEALNAKDFDEEYLCFFCGSSPGADSTYAEAARQLGTLMGRMGLNLVYGGGRRGLMGEVANAVLEAGGHVTGIITERLVNMEVAHTGLTDLQVVTTMHERKAAMAELADGFIALPGGTGTFEEFYMLRAA